MKRFNLWSLVVVLAVGNLLGCSRPSTKPPHASDGIRAGRGVAEGRRGVAPRTTQLKPWACIKRDKGSGRLSKPLRKAKDAIVSKDQERKLQAKNENQPHVGTFSFMTTRQELGKAAIIQRGQESHEGAPEGEK
jgi:hypothetical protein